MKAKKMMRSKEALENINNNITRETTLKIHPIFKSREAARILPAKIATIKIITRPTEEINSTTTTPITSTSIKETSTTITIEDTITRAQHLQHKRKSST
jgi:hypothetical protein